MSAIKTAFSHHYAGGNPSPVERLVWAFQYHRALYGADTPKRARGALIDARRDVAADKARFPISGTRGAYFDGRSLWLENTGSFGLRFVNHCDEIRSGIQHTGWFTNEFEDEKLRGAVWRLPSRKGVSRFVAGYVDPNNDGAARVDFSETYDDENDAAYAADSYAERAADKEREYNEAWNAGTRHYDLGEQIADDRREALELLAERRAARHDGARYPAMCAVISGKVESLLDAIRDARRERESLANDWGRYHSDAFNEGAQIAS